ncbi:Caf20 [Kluyveromyces lactis]|nr:Caf20 [Kluyveromyces lactis]
MIRYTEEELLQLRPTEPVKPNFNVDEFNAIIEKVKEIQEAHEEEFSHFRRRSSHHHAKPKFKHLKPKITTDEEGWSTLETAPAVRRKSVAEEEEPTVVIAQETLKVKPNKHISSSRPADARDIVADKPSKAFNAFAALESDEEEEQE